MASVESALTRPISVLMSVLLIICIQQAQRPRDGVHIRLNATSLDLEEQLNPHWI
jgi:hypothetical protein